MAPPPEVPAWTARWTALGARIAAAAERDHHEERWGPDVERFADMLEHLLGGWFEGSERYGRERLADAIYGPLRPELPHYAAERETARAWLTADAQDLMRREIRRAGCREVLFRLAPMSCGRWATPLVVFRGSRTQVPIAGRDLLTGGPWMLIHSHPTQDTEPSEQDLDACSRLVSLIPSLGFGIVDPECEQLYLLREPQRPEAT